MFQLHHGDERKAYDLQWMQFLKLNSEQELTERYAISKKEASNFLKIVNLCIRISRVNVFFVYAFCFGLQLRVLFVAGRTLSTSAFLFITLPNLLSFWTVLLTAYESVNCYLAIFVLTCFFIQKNLKFSTDYESVAHLLKRRELNELVRANLITFNEMLTIQQSSQEHMDLTLATLYSMFMSIGFAFPYVREISLIQVVAR